MKTSEKKQNLSPGKCQKCSSLGYSVRLIGGYNGLLCDGHLNEWHELVIDMPEYEDIAIKSTSLDALIRDGVSNQNSRDLTGAVGELFKVFYRTAKAWAEGSDLVTERQDGLYQKYNISKTNDEPIDPKAFYFPLRLDKDPHARKAARTYANCVVADNRTLARELHDLLDGIEHDLVKQIIDQGESARKKEWTG